MNDLIWIGNTLYPRGFVFMFPFLSGALGALAVFGIRWVIRWMTYVNNRD